MNFQQLRSVREAARRGYNLTEVAAALHTSQPGVSRQIRELEDELGLELFQRAGKRLTGMTPSGQQLLPVVERLLREAENLRQAARDCASHDTGPLSLAATHSQARYALPGAVKDFRHRFPKVTLSLHQGSPRQVAQMLIDGEADIGIATEALGKDDAFVTFPFYEWRHAVVVPEGHALTKSFYLLRDFPGRYEGAPLWVDLDDVRPSLKAHLDDIRRNTLGDPFRGLPRVP